MPVIKDGFEFTIDLLGNPDCLIIQENLLTDQLEYILNEKITRIYIPCYETKIKNLDFLESLTFIEKVSIKVDNIDYSGLSFLTKLEYLSVNITNSLQIIDYSQFKDLSFLIINLYKNFPKLSLNANLKSLHLYNYNPKSQSLVELNLPNSLKTLYLQKSNIVNFEGIDNVELIEIETYDCKSLISLSGLKTQVRSLEKLIIENSKQLNDYEDVYNCFELETLSLINCGDIPSIKWIEFLKKLNVLKFFKTFVQDGDLTNCSKVKYLYFDNKPSYNHKLSDFKRVNK